MTATTQNLQPPPWAVATVTECEACFTPDVCQLRGTCDHYAAECLRVAGPPVAQMAELVLQDIEQYRMQMACISTAALGYWTEADGIHPDYDTVPLRDVAKLYAKYAELHAAAHPQQPASEAGHKQKAG